jgi:hypothetical protein
LAIKRIGGFLLTEPCLTHFLSALWIFYERLVGSCEMRPKLFYLYHEDGLQFKVQDLVFNSLFKGEKDSSIRIYDLKKSHLPKYLEYT